MSSTGGIPFDREHVNLVLSTLTVDNPLLCGEQLNQLVIEGAGAFDDTKLTKKMREFASAFADNYLDPTRQTEAWFKAMYTVLTLVIAGLNYYYANRVQLRSEMDHFWPWLAPDRMRESTKILVNTAMPMPYEADTELLGDGAVYMIGGLYTNEILSKQLFRGNFPQLYEYIVQYATRDEKPEYIRHLAQRFVDGN
ncbi:hypothetical protein JAAARDRAFT_199407 [Jaapia argillacea MUCL 33604]|uniref:Uncharacterized protein n=1 Tax=Jaapia argillacea MUCL 33604 TaxID=933084 RepID=A0A067PJ21_9AGAM|nr:hypothetical protein JAAARDRAFT_199407 [Jaapia argillacea MUCL 33604]